MKMNEEKRCHDGCSCSSDSLSIEVFVVAFAETIKQRDLYDDRRRDAMREVELYRSENMELKRNNELLRKITELIMRDIEEEKCAIPEEAKTDDVGWTSPGEKRGCSVYTVETMDDQLRVAKWLKRKAIEGGDVEIRWVLPSKDVMTLKINQRIDEKEPVVSVKNECRCGENIPDSRR